MIRKSDVEAECNMKIVDSTVITGTGVTWPRGTMSTQSMGDVVVPIMMSTKKSPKYTELVCYYIETAPKLKRKRVV